METKRPVLSMDDLPEDGDRAVAFALVAIVNAIREQRPKAQGAILSIAGELAGCTHRGAHHGSTEDGHDWCNACGAIRLKSGKVQGSEWLLPRNVDKLRRVKDEDE